jgi:DNA-binding winged helix-turn-helix (wHTH) protein
MYFFDTFEVDRSTGHLYENDARVAVPSKAALVLTLLLDRAAECVSIDDILDVIAPERDIGAANVAQYIAILRKVLRDDARMPQLIESKYGKGYRFCGALHRSANRSNDGPLNARLLEGRYHLERRAPRSLFLALNAFHELLQKEPDHIAALVGAAEASSTIASHLLADPRAAFKRAAEFARRALRLDPTSPRAQSVLGHIALFSERDFAGAARFSYLALATDARDTLAIRVLGRLSMVEKNWEAARGYLLRELGIRPDSLDAMTMLAIISQYQRRPEEAANALRRTNALDATYTDGRYYLGACLIDAGLASDAVPVLRNLCNRSRAPHVHAALGRAYAAVGARRKAARIAASLRTRQASEYISPYVLAGLDVALADFEQARDRIREAFSRKDPWSIFYTVEPRFDPIRL